MTRPRPSTPPAPPRAALAALLPPDVDLDGELRHEAAKPVWFGVVWGRLGRGDLAWASFDRVRLPELDPWISAERGRLLRELGRHAEAEAVEWGALVRADDPVDAAMLRISLAADAIGLRDRSRTTSRLQAARRAVADLPVGPRAARQRLRLRWVEVESAWLRGSKPSSAGLPVWDEDAGIARFAPDYAAGSRFHVAKGLLFGGVVHGDVRLLDAAAEAAPPALLWAVHRARADAGRPGARQAEESARAVVVEPPSRSRAPAGGEVG